MSLDQRCDVSVTEARTSTSSSLVWALAGRTKTAAAASTMRGSRGEERAEAERRGRGFILGTREGMLGYL